MNYNPHDYPPFAVTVDLNVFTIRNGSLHILLVKRGGEPFAGSWALPGGFTGVNESTDDAALRELAEETNITPGAALDAETIVENMVDRFGTATIGSRSARILYHLARIALKSGGNVSEQMSRWAELIDVPGGYSPDDHRDADLDSVDVEWLRNVAAKTDLVRRSEFAAVHSRLAALSEDDHAAILRTHPDFHLEQLKTYSEPDRDPRMRVVSVSYVAFAPNLDDPRAGDDASDARWWMLDDVLSDDFELAFDHRTIIEDAVERVRSKLEYTTLATQFVGDEFTLAELRSVYATVWGAAPDLGNFRRKVLSTEGFVVPTERYARGQAGPAPMLFRKGSATMIHPAMLRPEEAR